MVLLLSVAGFVMLIAIIWCVRTMRRGFTSLDASKAILRSRLQEGELRLAKEQQEITTPEQIALLEAGVRDLLRLDDVDGSCTREDNDIHVTTQSDSWTLSYHTIEQTLHTRKTLHGATHWVLYTHRNNTTEDFPSIDLLMRAFQDALRGNPPATRTPSARELISQYTHED